MPSQVARVLALEVHGVASRVPHVIATHDADVAAFVERGLARCADARRGAARRRRRAVLRVLRGRVRGGVARGARARRRRQR